MGIKAYPEAAKGLYKVLLGQAFSAAAQLISIMVDATLGGVASLAGLVLNLMGLYQARRDDRYYGVAFLLSVATLVGTVAVNLAMGAMEEEPARLVSTVASNLLNLLNLAILLLVVARSVKLEGRGTLTSFGRGTGGVNIACTIVTGALTGMLLVEGLPARTILAAAALTLLTGLLGMVMYMVFLHRASQALGQGATALDGGGGQSGRF
ncbi:MAG TPA: hypothetical protein IAC84_04675 [Firmicutes bacterium]|nr:hypothetical protein [Candidatus Enterenecus merdae]HJH62546.1 hypothetical protein [Bacillota bacterium]